MDEEEWHAWFDGIWAKREERIYPAFFGDTGPGIYTIPESTFASLGHKNPDPRFLTHGVFECPPGEYQSGARSDWVYVTSGMSNPWGDSPETIQPGGFSGLGFEFTMHTRERARWPIQLLHWMMAVQLLVAVGEVKGGLLERGDRVPLGGGLWKKEGAITHLVVAEPAGEEGGEGGYPASFMLDSGKVELMLLVGISGREAEFGQTQGFDALLKLLAHHGVFPVTDPERVSVI